ncbi:TRAP transporter small permease [Anoxynatronum sibiricum]|uniref:TRAP transporter small permease n=1 Tax=Anoxynatronum sibiricum TaxID=210623 RepID=A0ABU9VWT9_9CLOT
MIKHGIRKLEKMEDIVLMLMFAVMVGVIFMQIIMRYVFNNSLSWSEELGKFLFVWLSWLGISIGHRRREHIRITLLVDRLPLQWNKIAEAVSELILVIICGITLFYSIKMMQLQVNIPYAGIKISTAWGYLSVALGCFFMMLRAAFYLYEALMVIFKGRLHAKEGL